MRIPVSLDAITERSYELYTVDSIALSERIFRGSTFIFFGAIFGFYRPFVTEHFQVEGLDAVVRGENAIQPQYLLLAQHNTWNDVINLPPVWFSFPSKHNFTGPTRTNYFPEHPRVNAFIDAMTKKLFFHVYRTATNRDVSIDEVERMQAANKQTRN